MKRPTVQLDKRRQATTRKRPGSAVVRAGLGWSSIIVVGLIIAASALISVLRLAAFSSGEPGAALPPGRQHQTGSAGIPQVGFTDITAAAGIDYTHDNGARGQKLLPETMGGGNAWFDFDSDGDQDLLLVNSRPWPDDPRGQTAQAPTIALYRNDGQGNFEDVTAGSGLDVPLYGMGVAVGDYDNDGRSDLFLSAVGANRLLHNEGGGKFLDVTDSAAVAGDANQWSTGCGWFDYDKDGDLDLFVCNYLTWSRDLDIAQHFRLPGGEPAYGRPQNFAGAFPYLYRNDGNGKFTDVSAPSGIQVRDATGAAMAKSLGVTFNDFDGDGWLDIFVANDTVQNQFFHNRGNGTFQEIGALVGVAFDPLGNVRGAMGIDSAHFRNDEAVGVAIGNFSNEMSALYVSYGKDLQFTDEAPRTGLGPDTQRQLTFGVCYLDYDLDGRLDLFAANGHLEPEINRVQPGQHYAQPPQLFWNGGVPHGREFLLVPSERCGSDLVRPIVGRGASFADIDGDGDLDLLIAAVGGAPRLLRNDQDLDHHWLRLKLTGTRCNRDAIGALVEVDLGDRTLRRRVMPTRSYLSQVELPLTIGLGTTDRVRSVTIHWPDGEKQTLRDLAVNRMYNITQQTPVTPALSVVKQGGDSPADAATTAENSGPDDQPLMIAERDSTCGHYLHAGVLQQQTQPLSQAPIAPRPCQGPVCSQAPHGQHAPLPAPTRLDKQHEHVLFCAEYPRNSSPVAGCSWPPAETSPHVVRDRVFRPPRNC